MVEEGAKADAPAAMEMYKAVVSFMVMGCGVMDQVNEWKQDGNARSSFTPTVDKYSSWQVASRWWVSKVDVRS